MNYYHLLPDVIYEIFIVYVDQEFKDSGLLYKMSYVIVATSLVRPKYYVAWKLSTLHQFH